MTPNQIKVEGNDYYFIASRADRPWGHAIDVTVFNNQNTIMGHLLFCCHPEFKDFELLQNYGTQELVALASEMISQGLLSNGFKYAWDAGLKLILRLNSPIAKFPDA